MFKWLGFVDGNKKDETDDAIGTWQMTMILLFWFDVFASIFIDVLTSLEACQLHCILIVSFLLRWRSSKVHGRAYIFSGQLMGSNLSDRSSSTCT